MYGASVKIDCITKSGIGQIFSRDPRINTVYELKRRKLPLLLNPGKIQIVIDSYRTPYDYVINLELGAMFNGLMRLIKAKNKIGMPYRYFKEPAETHAVENLHLIYKSFMPEEVIQYAVPSLQANLDIDLSEKYGLNDKYVVIVASNSHHSRKSSINHRAWPVEHWKHLLHLLDESNIQAVLIGGKGELAYFKLLAPLPESTLSLVGKTGFPELIHLIKHARAVVTTDTGPSHLAAAVNTPVIALIGPTYYKRTGPYQTTDNKVEVLNAQLPCSPCYHTERLTNCQDNICMSQILPLQVAERIKSYLD